MDIVLNNTESIAFADIFALKIKLPVNVIRCGKTPSNFDQQSTDLLNNTLFDIILASAEPLLDTEEIDEVILQQLRLTDAKVNLALTWLSRLISEKNSLPSSKSIEINTIGIRFESDNVLGVNDILQIQLYIDPQLAEPVNLQSDVVHVEGKTITANFSSMDLEVKDKLDKFIFREHRRSIAHQKYFRNSNTHKNEVKNKSVLE